MIIYGAKSTHLNTISTQDVCRHCNTTDNIQLSAYQKYAHIFWVPLFPIGKIYISTCNHCQNTLGKNEIKHSYSSSYASIKNMVKTPIWTFIGLGLFSLLVISSTISRNSKAQDNIAFLQSPETGDTYKYRTTDGDYSLLKVSGISGDTVFVFSNNYVTSKRSGLSKLMSQSDTTYSKASYGFLKSELLLMLEEKDILDIIRD